MKTCQITSQYECNKYNENIEHQNKIKLHQMKNEIKTLMRSLSSDVFSYLIFE